MKSLSEVRNDSCRKIVSGGCKNITVSAQGSVGFQDCVTFRSLKKFQHFPARDGGRLNFLNMK